ncbi:MAG: outer membrane beta-barrel protein [Bacteroidales bacterium]|nr:outer membrane beta-barrel protein [Bacteroidales bacterium]
MKRRTMRIRLLILIFALALITTATHAQYNNRVRVNSFSRGLWVNGGIGPNKWMGDLVDNGSVRLSGQIGAEKELTYFLSLSAEVSGGVFAGKQESGRLKFNTPYVEIFPGLNFYFLDLIMGYYPARFLNPYIGVGGGAILYSANKEMLNKEGYIQYVESHPEADVSWLESEKGFKTTVGFYGSIGAKHSITSHWYIFGEIRGVYVCSDEMDGHTGWRSAYTMSLEEINATRPANNQLTEQEYAKGQWHDGLNDAYYTMIFGVAYKFHNKGWRMSSKYNRRNYIENKKTYKRYIQGARFR